MQKQQILAHRGIHNSNDETKNSIGALIEAVEQGFGLETDIRDFKGDLYISHDPIVVPTIRVDDFLEILVTLTIEKR